MKNEFKVETGTIWDFPDRGSWSIHKGDYRGNWSPYVPKNILLRYSKENDIILDQFVGSGTTLIEAKLLNRRAIGCDVNQQVLNRTYQKLCEIGAEPNIYVKNCDARNLYFIKNQSIDLICTHPPYSNIIKYSNNIKNDLSLLKIEDFYLAMDNVAKECFRILKDKKYCAILMGDTRKNGYIVPLGFNVMNIFIKNGFTLKEIIIKKQHNCRSTDYWKKISIERNFYLIEHEYLFIFQKK